MSTKSGRRDRAPPFRASRPSATCSSYSSHTATAALSGRRAASSTVSLSTASSRWGPLRPTSNRARRAGRRGRRTQNARWPRPFLHSAPPDAPRMASPSQGPTEPSQLKLRPPGLASPVAPAAARRTPPLGGNGAPTRVAPDNFDLASWKGGGGGLLILRSGHGVKGGQKLSAATHSSRLHRTSDRPPWPEMAAATRGVGPAETFRPASGKPLTPAGCPSSSPQDQRGLHGRRTCERRPRTMGPGCTPKGSPP